MRRLRLFACTPRLIRGIVLSLAAALVRQHLLHSLQIRARDQRLLAQVALSLLGFLREDVTLPALHSRDLSRPCPLEALRCTAVRLHLRHLTPPRPKTRNRPRPCQLYPRTLPPRRPRLLPQPPPPFARPPQPRDWARESWTRSAPPCAADSRPRRGDRASPSPCRAAAGPRRCARSRGHGTSP